MRLRHVFTINAVICLLYGTPFAVAPALLLSMYGAPPNELGLLVARLFGMMLIGMGGILWQLRTQDEREAARAVALSLFVADAVSTVFFAQAALVGDVNALGWTVVAIYGLNTIAFGFFAFRRKPAAVAVT